MADWHEQSNGTSIVTLNPVTTAYKVILVLEKERIPRNCVRDVFNIVEDILQFQEVSHTARDERNPNFPK